MEESFWQGFEKRALLGTAVKKIVGLGAKAGQKAAKNPLKTGGLMLGGMEAASAAARASGNVANSRRLNQAGAAMQAAGRTF